MYKPHSCISGTPYFQASFRKKKELKKALLETKLVICSQMLTINLTKSLYCSDINRLIKFEKLPFQRFSLINFPIPCDWQQLSSLLKPTVERKWRNFNENKRMWTIQNVCLVTKQSFNEGSLDTRTWKHSLSRAFNLWKPSIGEKVVAKREFNNPMDKRTMKVVKGDETVGHYLASSPE